MFILCASHVHWLLLGGFNSVLQCYYCCTRARVTLVSSEHCSQSIYALFSKGEISMHLYLQGLWSKQTSLDNVNTVTLAICQPLFIMSFKKINKCLVDGHIASFSHRRKQPDYFQVKFYIGGLQLESFLQKWKRSILFLLG